VIRLLRNLPPADSLITSRSALCGHAVFRPES
jgi:hypothetical protein